MKEEFKMYDLVFHGGNLFIYCGTKTNNIGNSIYSVTFIESLDIEACYIDKERLPKGYVSKGTNTYFGWNGFTPDGPKVDLSKLKKHDPESIYKMLTSSDKDSFNLALEILKIEGII